MIDIKKQVTTALSKSGVKVMYELFINDKTKLPVITYLELDNKEGMSGDNLEYSDHLFQIKVWGTDIEVISTIGIDIDYELRLIGFKRERATELIKDGVISKVFDYKAVGYNRN